MNLQSNDHFQITIPLTKIDHERRMVIGVAALEQCDLANEIMDYDTAKPQFQEWSKRFEDATGGLSKGNLRVMHTKHVAGRLDQIAFNDDQKRIEVCAKISDANEWSKVLDGAYTGFSVGGGYANRWDDPLQKGKKRYTPRVAELSLVDAPCMPGARFAELLKADGIVEQLELRGRQPEATEPETFAALWKAHQEPVTFGELWKAQETAEPMTFGELMKADQKRDEKGRFASGGSVAGALATGGAVLGGGYLASVYGGKQKYHLDLAAHHAREAAKAADEATALEHKIGSADQFYDAASRYVHHADKFAQHNAKVMPMLRPSMRDAALSGGKKTIHAFTASIPSRFASNLGRMLHR